MLQLIKKAKAFQTSLGLSDWILAALRSVSLYKKPTGNTCVSLGTEQETTKAFCSLF